MKARRRVRRLLGYGGLLLCATAALGFGVRHYRRLNARVSLPTAVARQGAFSVLVNCRGTLSARRSAQLVSPVDVEDLQIIWMAPAGTEVKAGAAVIRFDPSKLRQELKEKTAALEQAQATLDQTKAQAQITADQDKLDLSTNQYAAQKAKLEASKEAIVSVIEGEKSKIDMGLAEEKVKVQLASSQLHMSSDTAKAASQRRLLEEAQAQVNRTMTRLGQLELRSPVEGLVTYLPNHSQGWMNAQPFKVGDHASAGQALAEIPDVGTLEMESKVDEVDRGRIALGDAVSVHVDALPETTFQAKLVAISPLTEQSFTEWPPTRSFRAFARIAEKNARLRPGMNAAADIVETRIEKAVSIPAKALFTANGKPVAYLQRNGVFTMAQVKVRARNTDEVAIEGIPPGSIVALVDPEKAK